jgi:hypothetical protein
MMDDLLITLGLPPFDRQIILAARRDNPKRDGLACDFVNLGIPGLLLIGEMNVTLKDGRFYVKAQAVIEELDKTVEAMVRRLITLVNQGVGAFNCRGFWIIIRQGRDVWIVLPQVRAEGSNVREKSSGIPMVQIAHGRS